jgi:hypothetical protein
VTRLAYQRAVHCKVKIPQKWHETETAVTGWLNTFLEGNSSLSICRPEAASLARAMNFNGVNINTHFENFLRFPIYTTDVCVPRKKML